MMNMRFNRTKTMWAVLDRAGVVIGYFTLDEKEQAIYTAKSFGGVAQLVQH